MNHTENNIKAGPKDNKKSKKGLFVKIVYGLAIIALITGGFLYFTHHKPKKNDVLEKIRYQKMINDTNQANKLNDIYSQKNIIENYLKDPPDNQNYLYEAEVRLTSSCVSLRLYTCANTEGKKAIKLKVTTYSVYELLGDTNSQLKNYKDAINYYNQALNILKQSTNPESGQPMSRIQYKLDYINGLKK